MINSPKKKSIKSRIDEFFILMGCKQIEPATQPPDIGCKPSPVSLSVDVDEKRRYPHSDQSRKMCLNRGSFRETIRSHRENVNFQLGTSAPEEDLKATVATDYPALFVKSSKMYSSTILESAKLNIEERSSLNDDCLICRDFSAVDTHAGNYPRQYVTSIPNLAVDLCEPFATSADKARAIFTWLHHNIAYDTKSYFQNNVRHQNPEQTLKTGLSVCQGYAELFQKLACHAGLQTIVISGHGKGYGYEANSDNNEANLKNHSWNAVKLDTGQWQLVDPCWGAGTVDEKQNFVKKLNTTAFTSSPETFRNKHFPSDPKHQFCEREMSWEEYVMMKEPPLLYDEFFDKEFSEVTIQPSCRIIKPHPTKFVIASKCPHTFIPPEYQYVLLLCIDGVRTPFQVDSNGSTWTCESSELRDNSTVVVGLLEKFGDRNGRGVTVDEYLNNTTEAYSWCHLCKWDVKK